MKKKKVFCLWVKGTNLFSYLKLFRVAKFNCIHAGREFYDVAGRVVHKDQIIGFYI